MESIPVLFSFGVFDLTATVVTTWGLLLALGLGSWLATRHLSVMNLA